MDATKDLSTLFSLTRKQMFEVSGEHFFRYTVTFICVAFSVMRQRYNKFP